MVARFALFALFAVACAGCTTKTVCGSTERNDGYSACEIYFDDCEDGRSRAVVCQVEGSGSFRCECRVDGARRRSFTDRLVCSSVDVDAYVTQVNDKCGWKLRYAEPE